MKICFLTWIFIFSSITISQDQHNSPLKTDLQKISEITVNYFSAPFNFNSKDFQNLGIISSVSALSSLLDRKVKNFNEMSFDSSLVVFRKFDSYYHLEFMSATIISLYIYGNLSNKNELRKLSTDLLTASILTGLTTFGIKTLVGRSRPYNSESPFNFNWFEYEDKFLSFPSGHTSLAFSFSTIMAEQNKNLIWKSIWFSAATLVGASRIYNEQHWFSDVVMGAIIGYVTAKFVLNQDKNNFSDLNFPTNNIVILIRL